MWSGTDVNDDDPCKGKADGNYPLPDVFSYITCKKGKSTIEKCPTGQIYFPDTKECGSIGETSLSAFCQRRPDGDWQNPWNCNGYILCHSGNSRVRPCLINGFVFDPYKDVCVRSKDYPCYTVPSLSGNGVDDKIRFGVDEFLVHLPEIKDICTTLPDGNYSTRDVFSILNCKKGKSKMIECPNDTIYVGGPNCTNATLVNEGMFQLDFPLKLDLYILMCQELVQTENEIRDFLLKSSTNHFFCTLSNRKLYVETYLTYKVFASECHLVSLEG